MGQCRETKLLSRINMMRSMSLLRGLEMKCFCCSRWVDLAVLTMVKVLWLWGALRWCCSLSNVQNFFCHVKVVVVDLQAGCNSCVKIWEVET